ncbi:MAG TPA: transcription antitermination factor NusB, partial [Thermoanaerobaculia bacterium]
MTERERALHLLRRIERESLFASLLLLGESGFVRTLVLGVLRWRSRLDFVIANLSGRRVEKLDPPVIELLRLGIYQLHYMDVPAYAAVSETVDLAGRHAGRARGFINAILRRASESKPEPTDLATRVAHPRWLLDRWTRAYGKKRAIAIAEANQELSYPDVLQLGEAAPTDGEPSTLVDGIYRLRESSADLDRADFYPMDEGSAVIAALAANSGDDLLDLWRLRAGR